MRQITKVEMNRAFHSRAFLFSLMVGCVMAMWYFCQFSWPLITHILKIQQGTVDPLFFEKINYATPAAEAWMGTHIADGYFMVLPVLCVIPYGISFHMDCKSGYVNQLVTRVGKKEYFKAKLLAVFVSGGVVAAIPLILNLITCMCFLPVMFPVASTQLFPVSAGSVLGELFYSKTWSFLYIMIYILFDFVFFGLLNCVCLVMSFLEDNRFTIALSPFIIAFAFHVLCGWVIGKSGYSPMQYTYFPRLYWVNLGIVLAEVLVLLTCALAFLLGSRRDTL